MTPKRANGLVTFLALLLVGAAHAVEPLPAEELNRICALYKARPYDPEAVACSAYIHGFLGGAHATGTAIAGEPKQRSEFMERATRTRAPGAAQRYGNFASASYCVPADIELSSVVERVIAYGREQDLTKKPTANQLVLGALRANYPCRAGSAR